ncbi:MAG: hypothetical protein EBT78_16115, partial [Betaproteobacteria bacterium]|nr:hypothetical protein [Betaproteobacteria bacterium]
MKWRVVTTITDVILFSRITLMSEDGIDRDQLIKELMDESFALRVKAEYLSQYVETKISELVKTKRELDSIKNDDEVGRLRAG